MPAGSPRWPCPPRRRTRRRAQEIAIYAGLHEAAAKGDVAEIEKLIKDGREAQHPGFQEPHAAARRGLYEAAAAARALLKLGANPNALEIDRYDIVTIAAVANDLEMLKIALDGGASAKNITSRYDGTALIAAAHLGHAEAVKLLIAAKAPLNHVNNLGWTALMEAVVLGNGGANHTATVRALVEAGATSTSPTSRARRHCSTPAAVAMSRWRGFWKTPVRDDEEHEE